MSGWTRHFVNPFHVTVSLVFNWICFDYCSATECNLYLAESTIPNAGLGVFSGIDLSAGDAVGIGDVAIPIFDITPDAIYDYIWAGETKGMKLETASGAGYVDANCPVSAVFSLSMPIIFQRPLFHIANYLYNRASIAP